MSCLYKLVPGLGNFEPDNDALAELLAFIGSDDPTTCGNCDSKLDGSVNTLVLATTLGSQEYALSGYRICRSCTSAVYDNGLDALNNCVSDANAHFKKNNPTDVQSVGLSRNIPPPQARKQSSKSHTHNKIGSAQFHRPEILTVTRKQEQTE